MIKLGPTGSTPAIVTLYDKSINLVNPYFTWNVVRKGTLDSYTFYQDDTSPAPYYYNKFDITIGTNSSGLTSGIVPLYPGEWIYNIYEMQNPYDLDLNNAIKLIENGLITIEGTFSAIPTYNGVDSNSIIVYRG